jgi:hypothetical protein
MTRCTSKFCKIFLLIVGMGVTNVMWGMVSAQKSSLSEPGPIDKLILAHDVDSCSYLVMKEDVECFPFQIFGEYDSNFSMGKVLEEHTYRIDVLCREGDNTELSQHVFNPILYPVIDKLLKDNEQGIYQIDTFTTVRYERGKYDLVALCTALFPSEELMLKMLKVGKAKTRAAEILKTYFL